MAEGARSRVVGRIHRDVAGDVVVGVISTVFDIIVEAWKVLAVAQEIDPKHHENPITDLLRREMEAQRLSRDPPPNYRFEREVQVDPLMGSTGRGKIDVFVIYSFNAKEYLAIECKKLVCADTTSVKNYITRGIWRFVSGKYSPNHPFGGMIGYVCDGGVETAADLLHEELKSAAVEMACNCGETVWQREERFGALPNCFGTRHRQAPHGNTIELVHVLLVVPSRREAR